MEIARQYPTASEALKTHYFVTLKRLARDLERFVAPRVSQNAHAKASAMGLPDIRQFRWKDQPTKMRDKDRSIFHWEHVVPTADIVNAILKKAPPIPTHEEVEAILRKAEVAWILKCEDRKLNALGHRANRADPAQAYRDAGITLLP